MFTLWYSILSWKEYRHLIWQKLSEKKPSNASTSQNESNGTPMVCPLPPKRQEPSKTVVVEPPKPPTQTHEVKSPPVQPQPQKPLEPPPKPPRSPSPHPIRTDAFEEIEYEEDSDIEEEEEEEENSVVDSFQIRPKPTTPWDSGKKTETNRNVNDFLKQERKEIGLNQR